MTKLCITLYVFYVLTTDRIIQSLYKRFYFGDDQSRPDDEPLL